MIPIFTRRRVWLVSVLVSIVYLAGTLDGTQATRLSQEARGHLKEIIGTLQTRWLHRGSFDWESFKQQVFQKAGEAQAIPETYAPFASD